MGSTTLQIGEIARRAGVSIDTVRYYEKRKLVHSVSRTMGGFRLFHPNTIDRIGFIKQAQEFGLSLVEIRELLSSGGADECRRMRDLLRQKLTEVDEQISKMKVFKRSLARHLTDCDRELALRGDNAECPAFFEIERVKS